MKKTVPAKNIVTKISFGLLTALFAALSFSSAEASIINSKKEIKNFQDSIVINRISENKDYSIELSSANSPHKFVISVNKQQQKNYQFYMFDINGNMKAQIAIKSNEKVAFVNIEKGNYYYEIMSGDEKIEDGQMTVK